MPDASTVNTGSTPPADHWSASLGDDLKPWAAGMGLDKLDAPAALAKVLPMYRGAEQKLGVPADQILRLPKDDNDTEGWTAAMRRLGAPEKPEDYGIQAPEGDSGEFLKKATTWFHELGIPKRQAAGLAAKYQEHVAASVEAREGACNQRFDDEINALKGEWGAEYDKNADLAKRVMKSFGYSTEQLQAMERALGPKAFLAGFAKFGGAIGEHRFLEGAANTTFGAMTPEAARERIAALQKDDKWMADYISGNADKKAEWTRLHQVAFPEPAAA